MTQRMLGGLALNLSSALSLRSSFTAAIAGTGLQPVRQFLFGNSLPLSAQKPMRAFGPSMGGEPGAPAINITNLADLANYFNAFEDATNLTTINSELQRYQPFNLANHAFVSDRLNLTALLPGGSWPTLVTQAVGTVALDNSTQNPIANLGLADTSQIQVGQLVAVEFKGIYRISAIVANTSVTIGEVGGSPTTSTTNNLIAFLPIYGAFLSAPTGAGFQTLNFSATPANVVAGMQFAYNSGSQAINREADYRVTSVTGTTAVISPPLVNSIGSGVFVVFMPAITSGQIWTRDNYDLTSPDCFFAVQGSFNFLNGPGSADFNPNNPLTTTLAQFQAAPADFPWGAYHSFWAYGANDPAGQTYQHNTSEMDFYEIFMNVTNGPFQIVGGDSTSPSPTSGNIYRRGVGGWTSGSSGFQRTPFSLSGPHVYGFIYTGGRNYRFIDDVLWQYNKFEWYSSAATQVAVNLSAGALNSGQAANFLFPMAAAGFPNMVVGIESLNFWYAPP